MLKVLIVLGVLLFLERLWKHLLVVRFFQVTKPPLRTTPTLISILQPILSGDPTMPGCLEHNLRILHDFPVEFLWLVDTTDEVGMSICHSLMASYPKLSIRLLTMAHSPQGQNPKTFKLVAALPAAHGDVICVLDDDTMLPADGVTSALPYLDEENAGLVFGLPYQVDFSNLWSKLIAYFVNSSSLLTYIPYAALVEPFAINGMFYAMRRTTLEAIGGFAGLEPLLADDFAVAQRVRRHGYRLVQTPLRHAVSNHVEGAGSYWQLLLRWLIFPRESLLRHLQLREVALLYAFALIPTLSPLLLVIGSALWFSPLLAIIGIGYLFYTYAIFVHTNAAYLNHISPLRWSWLVPIIQILLPLHLLAALTLPQRIVWRGHIMHVERGGGFRFIQRRK